MLGGLGQLSWTQACASKSLPATSTWVSPAPPGNRAQGWAQQASRPPSLRCHLAGGFLSFLVLLLFTLLAWVSSVL